MTDLRRLTVSLTKHNAHKLAVLLKDYPAAEVFQRLDEVHAERAQAAKNLSVLPDGTLPPVWSKAQALGSDAIDALLLIAIIFSHHKLIAAMADAAGRDGFAGQIRRPTLDGKEHSNFARVIDQLGYATRIEKAVAVTFNLRGMFELPGLGPLVAELLELKLLQARWDRANTVAEEAVRLGFQRVFGVGAQELQAWLNVDAQPTAAASSLSSKDEQFFRAEDEGTAQREFAFKAGHVEREVEPVTRSASPKSKATRLHNDIQNKLYAHLADQLGPKYVGTEVDTGSGTSIDVVTQKSRRTTFYEIKTAPSVRANIRQALPQLLEYAYWPEDQRADDLVIVSHLPLTRPAAKYLKFLRDTFGMPISYRQFDMDRGVLV